MSSPGLKKNSPNCLVPALSWSSGIATPSMMTVGSQPGLNETPTNVCLGAWAPSWGISASNPVGRVEGCGAPRVDEAIQITNTNAKKTNIVKDDATPFLRLQLPPGLSVIQLFF